MGNWFQGLGALICAIVSFRRQSACARICWSYACMSAPCIWEVLLGSAILVGVQWLFAHNFPLCFRCFHMHKCFFGVNHVEVRKSACSKQALLLDLPICLFGTFYQCEINSKQAVCVVVICSERFYMVLAHCIVLACLKVYYLGHTLLFKTFFSLHFRQYFQYFMFNSYSITELVKISMSVFENIASCFRILTSF